MDSNPPSETLRSRFKELVSDLDIDPYYTTFHTTPQHDGSPHIEKKGNEYHFVVTERGSEFERIKTDDPEEILYMLVEGVTFTIATQYELKNRIEDRDGREMWFPYQEQLLSNMKKEWGERKRSEHDKILKRSPIEHSIKTSPKWKFWKK
jgi:hypothetical protein